MDSVEIVDTNADNILRYGICGYSNVKKPGFLEKVEWYKKRLSEGMKIKTLYSHRNGTQSMIEYIPVEYCWRPVICSFTVYLLDLSTYVRISGRQPFY